MKKLRIRKSIKEEVIIECIKSGVDSINSNTGVGEKMFSLGNQRWIEITIEVKKPSMETRYSSSKVFFDRPVFNVFSIHIVVW